MTKKKTSSIFTWINQSNFVAQVAFLLLVSLLFPTPAFAAEEFFRQTKEHYSPDPFIQPDLTSGAFVHTQMISIPPGRNGMHPDLKLTYSSNDKRSDSIIGHGWSLNIPYIERLNKLGSDKLYNQTKANTTFYSSLSGELLPVVSTTTSERFLGFSYAAPSLSLLKSFSGSTPTKRLGSATGKSNSAPLSSKDAKRSPVKEERPLITRSGLTERTWNANIQISVEDEKRKIGEFHTKQINYLDEKGKFAPIVTDFIATSSGSFLMERAPFRVSVPPYADGVAVFVNNNRFDTRTKKVIKEPDLTTSIRALNVAHVPGRIERGSLRTPTGIVENISYVVYQGAYPTGDLIYYVHHGRIPRIEKMVRFHSAPPTMQVAFSISAEEELSSQGISLRRGTSTTRGVGFKKFYIWDSASTTPLVGFPIREIEKTLTTGADGYVLTKHLPRDFFETAVYPVYTDATLTVYPDADTETATVDGYAFRGPEAGDSWATMTGGAGDTASDNSSGGCLGGIQAYGQTNASAGYTYLVRGFHLYDTSVLGSGVTINAATSSLYAQCTGGSDTSETASIYGATPASNTSLVAADYSQTGTTAYSDTAPAGSSISTSAYTDFLLNSTGRSNISLTGITKFSLKYTKDSTGVDPGWGASAEGPYFIFHSAEAAGTNNDPKLVIDYTEPPGPAVPTGLHVESQTNPTGIATSSPRFSAIHVNASSTALASSYAIQISRTPSSWSSLYWDSGKKALSSSTPPNMRIPQMYSTTTFPIDGSTAYYWRIKFWDQYDQEGAWSTSTSYFVTSFAGDYAAKVDDGSFLRYTLSTDNTWITYDKKGMLYRFGHSTSTRLSDPSSATTTFRWYLEEMRDPLGNSITYSYATTSVASGATSQIYPYKVTYTTNGASTGIYEIEFVRESRSDIATSSIAGFQMVTTERIKEILVRANGQLVKRYQLGYTAGENGARSLLASFTESGWDASSGTTTLPAAYFHYSASTHSWTENTDATKWQLPGPNYNFADNTGGDAGGRMYDANGDSLLDVIFSTNAFINTGNTWATSSGYVSPENFTSGAWDSGARLGDINGDGYIDIVRSKTSPGGGSPSKKIWIGSANGFRATTTGELWDPLSFIDTDSFSSTDRGVRLVDVNGDGLADLAGITPTYINNGIEWVADYAWSFPDALIVNTQDGGTRILDLNGDGLADVFVSRDALGGVPENQRRRVYLNTGHNWQQASWDMTYVPFFVNGYGDTGYRFIDANGDQLPDIVGNGGYVLLNTGGGWTNDMGGFPTNPVQTFPSNFSKDLGVSIEDVNGDGLFDVVKNTYDINNTSDKHVWIKSGTKADMLTSVKNEKGGTLGVMYGRTSQLASDGTKLNGELQIAFDVVNTVAHDPGFGGQQSTTTYSYRGGQYYYGSTTERHFTAFATTTESNSQGHAVRRFFHQGNYTNSTDGEHTDHIAKIGKPYRVETLDATSTANVFTRTINKWARAAYNDGRNFVKLIQSVVMTYDGDTTHKDTATIDIYDDTTGNLTERAFYGEVSGNTDGTFTDSGSDRSTTTLSYAASSTNSVISLPSRELLVDHNSSTVRETKWYYDSLAHGSVSAGTQTKEEKLVSGSIYASTTKTYNSYGLVTESRDPLGNRTTYSYDTHNLYPTTITNALGYTTTFEYDYSSGKVATTTDPNSRTFATVYDGLDRPIEEKQPDFASPSTLVLKTSYTYTQSTSSPWSILKKDWLSFATATELYTYLDGLGRALQTRKEAENGYYIVRDSLYNNIGKLRDESLPYFSSGSSRTTATSAPYLFTTFAYDPEGRITTTANAVGTTTNSYSDWRLKITDPLSNVKEVVKDAYGNLANVVEWVSSASSATTTYDWNRNGKLTKITDASGNIRNFTYDNLGRLLTSEDLHAVSDITYGTSSRQYDLTGNLVQLYSPLGLATNYTYDALNRVTSEDSTTTPSLLDIVYSYDTCTNGKGRVCEVNANNAATTTYVYNPIGLVATEAKKIGTTTATTTTSYFRTGIVDTITYPTSHQIAYVYNDAGDLNRVLGLSVGSTTWHSLIESTNYGPTGQPTFVDYGNNTQTTYSYDATKLYRLTRKLTLVTPTAPSTSERLLFLGVSMATATLDALLDIPEELPFIGMTLGTTTEIDGTTGKSMGARIVESSPQPVGEETQSDSETSASTTQSTIESAPVLHPFLDSLTGLSAKERANKKGEAIAALGPIPKTRVGDYSVEVVSFQPIDGGVEYYARAWDTDDQPIGFGRDGSVEIERFRAMNPPILVGDPVGTIERRFTDRETGLEVVNTYREDLREATLQDLAHTISVKKQRFGPNRIIPGKVGRTTLTARSTDGNNDPVDNYMYRGPQSETFANIRSGNGEGVGSGSDANNWAAWLRANVTSNQYQYLVRGMSIFDTSAITTSDTVDSATFSWKCSQTDSTLGTADFHIFFGTTAANNSLAASDYQSNVGVSSIGSTSYSTANTNKNITASSATWNNITLSSLSGITKGNGARTKIGYGLSWDVQNTTTGLTWSSGQDTYIGIHFADTAGTTDDPKLVVEYTSTTVLQDLNYTYDAAGNVTNILDISGTNAYASTSYSYDGLYRLTRASSTLATLTNWLQSYAYDILGNITSKSDVGSYTYAGTNFANPHAPTTINGVSYDYDNAGNLTSYGSTVNSWNYRNRLLTTNTSGTTTAYTYDHADHRVQQDVRRGAGSTTTTKYFNRYYETTGGTTTLYVFVGDQLLSTIEGNGNSTSTYITHTDHLNGTNVVTDKSGNQTQLATYYPFGAKRNNETSSIFTEKRGFVGQYEDEATSLSYLNARYYDGTRGQFLSQDPLANAIGTGDKVYGRALASLLASPQELNTYSYAQGNPINKSDPTGLSVYLEARPLVFGLGSHMYIRAVPDNPGQLSGNFNGVKEFTLGAYNPDGAKFWSNQLQKGVGTADNKNAPAFADFSNKAPTSLLLAPPKNLVVPKGMSADSAFINQITQSYENTGDRQSYNFTAFTGNKNTGFANSNNFAFSVLTGAGATSYVDNKGNTNSINSMNAPGWTPGWGFNVPSQAQQASARSLYYTNSGGK
jgi:RHS repeat-associated protein